MQATVAAPPLSRRRFVQGAGVAGVGLLAGCMGLWWQAQQKARVARLGWLWSTGIIESSQTAFLQALRDLGYVLDGNIAIEYRTAHGRSDNLRDLAAELVQSEADIIVASGGTPSVQAAKLATSTIPIVMTTSGDPVRSGLVESLARPGGNVTGLSIMSLSPKRLEMLRNTVPGVSRVGVLWNPANPSSIPWSELESSAQDLGLSLHGVEVRSPDDFDHAFGAIAEYSPDALDVESDGLLSEHLGKIVNFAAQHSLPAVYGTRQHVDAGGLMAYGPNVPDVYRRAAAYVDKILKGAIPAELPVEQPMTFDFVINLKTAQALGLTIPQHVLLQATEVIQYSAAPKRWPRSPAPGSGLAGCVPARPIRSCDRATRRALHVILGAHRGAALDSDAARGAPRERARGPGSAPAVRFRAPSGGGPARRLGLHTVCEGAVVRLRESGEVSHAVGPIGSAARLCRSRGERGPAGAARIRGGLGA